MDAHPMAHRGGFPKRTAVLLLLSGVLLTGSGCPLATYEEKMAAQQVRLDYMDEQNKALEKDTLVLPDLRKVDKDALPADQFFLRPPKGIPTQAVQAQGNLVAKFSRASPFPGLKELSVIAISSAKPSRPGDLQKDILANYGVAVKSRPKLLGEQINHKLSFDWYHQTLEDQTVLDLYLYKQVPYFVALVFRSSAPAANEPAGTENIIDYCLTSLSVGPDALRQRSLVKKSAPPAPAPSPGERD